ncbi:DUF1569 domain-containing protein [Oligoflexus tunisiensis]|uniref:DUF1569 domain-containing protein n=1 Tax=Oligoflexus tunisiensis TaxID=708132 RepID=UPI00114D26EC|nr:DUF1569 domain-containing protein [Oligoflexus tunisiensis]
MKRREFLKFTVATPFAILLSPLALSCTSRKVTLAGTLDLIAKLKGSADLRNNGKQTVHQVIRHCIQGVHCALEGYPEVKAAWFQNSIGKAVFHIFTMLDTMKHDRNDPTVPGMPAPAAEGDIVLALTELEEAFRRLEAAAAVKPHFFYGELSPQDMLHVHLLHFYDHVGDLSWKAA